MRFFVFVIAFLLSSSALAFGASNLSFGGYPRHSCHEPSKPFSKDKFAGDTFREDVKRYEQCIKEYVEATENDSRAALDKGREAARDYNNFMQRIQY